MILTFSSSFGTKLESFRLSIEAALSYFAKFSIASAISFISGIYASSTFLILWSADLSCSCKKLWYSYHNSSSYVISVVSSYYICPSCTYLAYSLDMINDYPGVRKLVSSFTLATIFSLSYMVSNLVS